MQNFPLIFTYYRKDKIFYNENHKTQNLESNQPFMLKLILQV